MNFVTLISFQTSKQNLKGKYLTSGCSKGCPLVLADLLAEVGVLLGRHAAAVQRVEELMVLRTEPHAGAGLTRRTVRAQDRHAVQGGRLDESVEIVDKESLYVPECIVLSEVDWWFLHHRHSFLDFIIVFVLLVLLFLFFNNCHPDAAVPFGSDRL